MAGDARAKGQVGAACDQEPELAAEASAYLCRRVAALPAVTVEHTDLLVLP